MTWLARNFPRRFGIPEQVQVNSLTELFYFLNAHNKKKNCYVSVNAYTDKELTLEQIVLDFDGSLEDALADVRTACSVLKDLGIEYRVFFSGKKGFHLRIPVRSYKCGFMEGKKITRAVQVGICAGLKTMDKHLIGDVKRILRFPNTMHVDSRLYCVEVQENMELGEILKSSEKPKKLTPIQKDKVPTAPELGRRFEEAGLIVEKERNHTLPFGCIKQEYSEIFVSDEVLRKLFPQGCYRRHLRERNPPHTIRVGSCIWLVYLGFDLVWLLNFYRDLAYKYDWEDKENAIRREKSIFDLFQRKYLPMSCGKIKERGYCAEEECEWKKL